MHPLLEIIGKAAATFDVCFFVFALCLAGVLLIPRFLQWRFKLAYDHLAITVVIMLLAWIAVHLSLWITGMIWEWEP